MEENEKNVIMKHSWRDLQNLHTFAPLSSHVLQCCHFLLNSGDFSDFRECFEKMSRSIEIRRIPDQDLRQFPEVSENRIDYVVIIQSIITRLGSVSVFAIASNEVWSKRWSAEPLPSEDNLKVPRCDDPQELRSRGAAGRWKWEEKSKCLLLRTK